MCDLFTDDALYFQGQEPSKAKLGTKASALPALNPPKISNHSALNLFNVSMMWTTGATKSELPVSSPVGLSHHLAHARTAAGTWQRGAESPECVPARIRLDI